MKDSYHISEISKLYGVGVDSLRYYERLGVLRPKRDVNGYRLYSLKDIYKLNIIRDLRQMGFSMRQIKRYLEDRTVDSTIRLLAREKALLQEQRRQIRAREAALQARMTALREAMAMPGGPNAAADAARAPLRAPERAYHAGRGNGFRHQKAPSYARKQNP